MPSRILTTPRTLFVLLGISFGTLLTSPVTSPAATVRNLWVTDYTGDVSLTDHYGSVMASSGDWLAIYAEPITSPLVPPTSGSRVLLWKRDSATGLWALKQTILCPVTFANEKDGFGGSMAMDGPTLLLSSHVRTDHGQAHFFRLDASLDQWLPDGTHTSPIAQAGERIDFGTAVAVRGDLAVVTSPYAYTHGTPSGGRGDLYRRENGAWTYLTALTDPTVRYREAQGASVAISGDGKIYLGSPKYGSGSVAVYKQTAGTWAPDRGYGPLPQAGGNFGHTIRAAGDSVHMVGDRHYTIVGPGLHTFTMPQDIKALAVNASGTQSVLCLSSGEIRVFSLPPLSPWVQESVTLSSSNFQLNNTIPGAVYAGVEESLMLGGHLTLSYPLLTPRTISSTVNSLKKVSGVWKRGPSLVPDNILRVRDGAYGSSIASTGAWTAVGAPHSQDVLSYERPQKGLVYLYRGQPDGSHRFHSLLPDPVPPGAPVPVQAYSQFGRQITLAGSLMAVGSSLRRSVGGYAGALGVAIYRYDATADAWVQEAYISPPHMSDSWGHSLSLYGDFLLIGDPQARCACLYQRMPQAAPLTCHDWILRQTFRPGETDPVNESFGYSVSLGENAAVVGSPILSSVNASGAAYLLAQHEGSWRITRRGPANSPAQRLYGQTVSLSHTYTGTLAVVGGDPALSAPGARRTAEVFRKSSQIPSGAPVWLKEVDLSDPYSSRNRLVLLGEGPVAFTYDGFGQVRGHTQKQGVWNTFDSFFTSPDTQGMALAHGQLFSAGLREVIVTDFTTAPLYQVVGVDPTVIQECVSGGRLDTFFRADFTGQGDIPATLRLSLEGGDASDFELLQPPLWIVAPGAVAQVRVAFTPKSPGLKHATLRILDGTPGGVPRLIPLSGQSVSQATTLTFTQQPVSGSMIHALMSRVQGTRPWTVRWFRNGVVVPGAIDQDLVPLKAGRYKVEFTNSAGSITSREVNVHAVQLPSPAHHIVRRGTRSATWTFGSQGPGIRIEWVRRGAIHWPWQPVDPAFVRGTSARSTLTIPATDNNAGLYGLHVHSLSPEDGQERTITVELSLTVASLPRVITPWDYLPAMDATLYHSTPYEFQLDWDWDGPRAVQGPGSPRYACTGLPPGLTLDPATGLISGLIPNANPQPVRPAIYTVKAQVSVGSLASAVVTHRLALLPPRMPPPGIYEAVLDFSPSYPLGAHVTLSLEPGGTYSATLRTGLRSLRFAGVLRPQYTEADPSTEALWEIPALTSAYGPQRLALVLRSSRTMSLWFVPNDYVTLQRELAQLELIRPATEIPAPTPWAGRQSIGLIRDGGYGSGFGTLTIGSDRRITFTGQSPEGKGITASSWAFDSGSGWDMSICFYATDNATTSLFGRPTLPSLPRQESSLAWCRLPDTRRVPEVVESEGLRFLTSRPLPAITAAEDFHEHYTLQLYPDEGYVDEHLLDFRLTRRGSIHLPPAASNPLRMRLSLYVPTGFFSGSSLLHVLDDQGRARTRTVNFRGMFLPEHKLGVGHFLTPSPLYPASAPRTMTGMVQFTPAFPK